MFTIFINFHSHFSSRVSVTRLGKFKVRLTAKMQVTIF